MKHTNLSIIVLVFCVACQSMLPTGQSLDTQPDIFPDYKAVTIPPNIAPLNFKLESPVQEAYAEFHSEGCSFHIKASEGKFSIPAGKWRKLLASSVGGSFEVTVYEKQEEWKKHAPFSVSVATEPVDPYMAYRLIEPGYELWDQMGLYQRNLESYKQTAIMENKLTDNNCMNCHSFCMQDPERMLFHIREAHASTFMFREGRIEKLNTKTPQTISFLVYPSWHPSGKYVAFSVNKTGQVFHSANDNRIEVFDEMSDVVVYDVETHEIITSPLLSSSASYETFPTFSPDGKTLYFCSADSCAMPMKYEDIKYNLCALSFDPVKRSFGTEVDTLYNAIQQGRSAKFPRVSPDGNFLMYTLSDYGNFSIWHKDADLYMVNLQSGESYSLDNLNSQDVDSYHSWSSNSRWVVFSSRRIDGLYTRPYIGYIHANGEPSKPFLVPQKDPDYYRSFMKSYNIPEFITGKVKNQRWKIGRIAKSDPGIDVKYVP